MRRIKGLLSLCLVTLFAASAAQAYTPESGIWWNPSESGTGVVIEVQDNFMVVAAFVGDAQGRATWYTAGAFLTGNARFDGSLDLTVGSQCPGCAYPGFPTVQAGAGGSIRIVFDANDPTKASLTWANGRTIPIERYPFYLRRPEDGNNVSLQTTKMLGEWQAVMDFSSSSASSFDYYGDVWVFDEFSFDNPTNRYYYDGCRPDNSQVGGCSTNALAFHSASGYYDSVDKLQVVVVDDSAANYALYLIETGTNSGQGEITVYPKGANPSNYDSFPMRAFRTASRTFVQEGTGPSKKAPLVATGISDKLAAAGKSLQSGEGVTSKFDRAALGHIISALEARLEAKRAQ